MSNILLADATDLASWANHRIAQGDLPDLIRRLIITTVHEIIRIGIRAQEGVQMSGWDGIVEVNTGNAFVPGGITVFEFGTNTDIRKKAEKDYSTRSSDPLGIKPQDTTFIFITPRRWAGKNNWVADKNSNGIWKEVRAYDADDIEAWLQISPSVHIWFSSRIGKSPEGVLDLETFWLDWTKATSPYLSSQLIIGGRDELVKSIHDWISQPPDLLSLHADTQEEALALLAAALLHLPENQREANFHRCLIIHNALAWRQVVATGQNLLLVPLFDNPNITDGLQNGHHVFTPTWGGISPTDKSIIAPRIHKNAAEDALLAIGFQKVQAEKLASIARRSMLSLRRKLAIGTSLQQPSWAKPEMASIIIHAMLAGQWTVDKEGDKAILALLANEPYEDVERTLSRWAIEPDPPVRRVGNVWYIVSKDDAWLLLSRMITQNDLGRFKEAVIKVLGSTDPALELPNNQRWQATILGHSKVYSDLLRRGLADTLAMIGSLGYDYLFANGRSAQDYANELVYHLLTNANEEMEGRLWASLEDVLPLMGEAAPDIVLEQIDQGVTGNDPILGKLFIDREQFDPLFTSSPHTGLLWTLELLAWNATYLSHSTVLLALLDNLDPGGRLMNRPITSLREIFLPWHPQTAAPIDQRIRVIDTLRERYPNVAWHLLIQLLPQPYNSAMSTASPQWRDWKPEVEIQITYIEWFQMVREIGNRLLIDAGLYPSRWQELIDNFSSIPTELRNEMIDRMLEIDIEELGETNATDLYEALRTEIVRHRHFRKARWALPKEQTDRLQEVYERFVPADPILKLKWLFLNKTGAFEFEGENREEREKKLTKARQDAVQEILNCGGQGLIVEFCSKIEVPIQLGIAIGQSGILSETEQEFLTSGISYTDVAQASLASGYVIGRFDSEGWDWAEQFLMRIAPNWSPLQRSIFLLGLPRSTRTWNWAEQFGPQTEKEYWQRFNPFGIPDPSTYIDATRKLNKFECPGSAISLLGLYLYRTEIEPPPELVADVLEQAAHVPVWESPNWNILAQDMIQLLDYIEESKSIDEQRLAALEWMYLPLFEYEDRPAKLLHSTLSRDPFFFVEVIKWVYRSEEEPREITQEEKLRALYGDKLLRTWRIVPGTLENGGVDGKLLTDWTNQARKKLIEFGRIKVTDHIIGQVLAYGPHDSDRLWPCKPIRDLIDFIGSKDLEQGFEVCVFNQRGAYSKDPLEGGQQERQLAEKYLSNAKSIEDGWPRTAAMLRRIVREYIQDAHREDIDAELREDLR